MKYEEGFYWVQIKKGYGWEIMQFFGKVWMSIGSDNEWNGEGFYKIGPKIEAPE